MFHLDEITCLAESLLAKNPDPIPRFRLIRDVLALPNTDPRWIESQRAAAKSPWVVELEDTQQENGTWGRFHSQDTTVRQRFVTTECAVQRALLLGLDKNSDLLKRAAAYMVRHLCGEEEWSDPPEKHDGWPVNIRFVTAATLSRIDPDHPELEPIWKVWAEITSRTFHGGEYDAGAEAQAHRDLLGIRSKHKYLKLWMMYPFLILSSTRHRLPDDLEAALLNWSWTHEQGMYYAYSQRLDQFPAIGSHHFLSWLVAIELLARFKTWRETMGRDALAWLWEQRNRGGLWDLGPKVSRLPHFPLSDGWRKPLNRQIDSSTRILTLLRCSCIP
jgi:hypothetical protein